MERLKLDLVQLNRSVKTLASSFEVLEDAYKIAHLGLIWAAQDSIIQRFEYTYEALWKFLKKYLEQVHHLDDINSPKKVFRAAVKTELCTPEEGDACLDMADDRNETSHTYNIETSRVVLSDIPAYYDVMLRIVERFNHKLGA